MRSAISSGVAKWGRSAPGGTFMGAALWAMLWAANCKDCIEIKVVLMSGHYSQ